MRELEEYAEKAVAEGALAVILIGSLARGNYTAYSDADIIIIVKESPERPIDRIARHLQPKASIDIEPRVYTMGEIREMIRNKARIIREIAEHGILLKGDEGIISEIKKAAP